MDSHTVTLSCKILAMWETKPRMMPQKTSRLYIFQKVHVTITYIVTVFVLQCTSVLFPPYSAGCNHFCLKNLLNGD